MWHGNAASDLTPTGETTGFPILKIMKLIHTADSDDYGVTYDVDNGVFTISGALSTQ